MLKDNIFDRAEYLNVLQKRTAAFRDGYRQNIALIGDDSIGKTSIISKFLDSVCESRLVFVYLDVRQETLVSFARRFIGVLLYNFLINSNLELKENLDFLVKKASSYIPHTVSKINSLLSDLAKGKKENMFSELLSLCESLYQETQKRTCVILDEFHNLEFIGKKRLYAEWSKLLITQKNTMYIIISSRKHKAQVILSKELSLLFGNFELITIEPFDMDTTGQFIDYLLPGLNLSRGIRNFIVNFTGGTPLYVQMIAEALSHAKEESLVDILENLLFSSSGIMHHKFSNYLKRFQDSRFSSEYQHILYLVASGHNKYKEISHLMRKPQAQLRARIDELLESDVISRTGDFLKINDRVFGFWLKFVYQEKLHSLTFDAKSQKAAFRKSLESMLQEFLLDANKPVTERIIELLRLFENDTIQFEKKKIKLYHFREIKPLEFGKPNLREGLLCRSTDSLWIMGLNFEPLTEDDISEFAKECKKFRHKMQRKIIIAFKNLDENSRLRALDEKILTLNLEHLNQILDLYSRPRIIA
ncbi:MAG: hypothetical protein C4540_04280 [Candidatus Omnitrophota bacterium]|nr:MAG: hypothetical protein C4540_04280 [Candidatus Omnitrophota bacterium]